MTLSDQRPAVEFFKLIPEGRAPKRADRTAAGYLPARAMRYCDALTTATGYGYWLFPPADLQLLWDGERVLWSHGDGDAFAPLSDTPTGAVQFPGFESRFDASAPTDLAGYSIPYLTAGLEPGSLQMWTGLIARTRPGWSLSIRQPVNLPPPPGISFWEGIIETDQWLGPIFTVLKICKTDIPVRLRANMPFLQAQPVPQAAYQESTLNDYDVADLAGLSEQDWSELQAVIAPPEQAARQGAYAVKVRKRRTCPHHAEIMARALDPAL